LYSRKYGKLKCDDDSNNRPNVFITTG